MACRPSCGACCIAPSIRDPFFGMPNGKPAGVRCVHLEMNARCALWGRPERPQLCADFTAEPEMCGKDRADALQRLTILEKSTKP